MKIKKGDSVIVLSGKDKGKDGKVLRVMPKHEQVLVDGVNVATKHQKARRRGSVGQIIQKPMPIHISKVGLKDEKTGKPTRVGYTFEGEGKDAKKVRISRGGAKKA